MQLENNEIPDTQSDNPAPPQRAPAPPKNALEMMMSSGGTGFKITGLQGLELKSLLANSVIYDFKGRPKFTDDKKIREKCTLVLEFLMENADDQEKKTLNQRKPERNDQLKVMETHKNQN